MNKNEVVQSCLIRTIAKLLLPKNKSQIRLLDDLDDDNWSDYKTQGEKVTICDDKLLFRYTGVVFTLKGDILSLITDYQFNKTDSPDAKQIINFLDDMHFEIHSKGKSLGDRTNTKTFYNKRALLASGLHEVIFLSKNLNELCDRLRLIFQEKQAGTDTSSRRVSRAGGGGGAPYVLR